MYNAKIVIPVLLVFLGLLTYPLWSPKGSHQHETHRTLAQPKGEQCVESARWMRANHMQLLENWRHSVVRDQQRTYVATDGKHYDKSLTNTCLGCHGPAEHFCDECHGYTSVKPYCWTCHLDEPPAAGSENPHSPAMELSKAMEAQDAR
ncbi:MAG: sulfate reduction electron transfer complex DsrMKJOP subunit DsrJ [bacterium]|nr:sulfate reduction electron transfer complex DsrMKJOP subunit DsrJ [bacterium]